MLLKFINLSNHLPEELKKSLMEEIEIAKVPGKIKLDTQVKWVLIKEIIIVLN